MRLKRPILLFIMDKKHRGLERGYRTRSGQSAEKLDAFRERAKRDAGEARLQRVYETFESLEQFSAAAAIAIGSLDPAAWISAASKANEIARSVASAHSNIPISVPRHFLGREEDLAAIDAALKSSNGRAAITTHFMVCAASARPRWLQHYARSVMAATIAQRGGSGPRPNPTMRADLVGAWRAARMGRGG